MGLALVAVRKGNIWAKWLALIGINFIYACTYICMKEASAQAFMSFPFLLWIIGAICIMGLYALLWQQILVKIPLSSAYVFKGTCLIFVLLLSAILFNESITATNAFGTVMIILGIVLYAKT